MIQNERQKYINRLFAEVEKIIPAEKFLKFFGPFLLISLVILIALTIIQNNRTKKVLYQTELHLKLGECIDTPNYRFYKVKGEWYGVQGPVNGYICPNDSVFKEKNTLDLFVIKPNGEKIKYKSTNNTFVPIESNKKLKNYFRINADTLTATFECID